MKIERTTNLLTAAILSILLIFIISPVNADTGGKGPDVGRIASTEPFKSLSKEVTIASLEGYSTYTYTHSDLLIFGYTNGTAIEVYDSSNALIWSGIIDAGGHLSLTPGAGVYKIIGTNPYSVIVGDELTSYVMGYYAFDQWGKGLSTLFYTYQVDTSSWTSPDYRNFIVFAYNDNTNVEIINTVTGIPIWTGTLNKGQHHEEPTLSDIFITVRADKPVSALSYTDQGYYVPAETGTFSGKTFYTWAGNSGGWGHALQIVAYTDSTSVTVKNTDTNVVIWNGVLNEGEVKYVTGINSQYLTVESDKDVNVAITPYGAFTGSYYYSVYGQDSLGSGIGTLFYFPAISGGNLIIFSYANGTQVEVTDSTNAVVWSGSLDEGQNHEITPSAFTVYKVKSTNLVSTLFDWGNLAGADFAPQFYAVAPPAPVPALTPIGIAAFAGLLGVVAVVAIRRRH